MKYTCDLSTEGEPFVALMGTTASACAGDTTQLNVCELDHRAETG